MRRFADAFGYVFEDAPGWDPVEDDSERSPTVYVGGRTDRGQDYLMWIDNDGGLMFDTQPVEVAEVERWISDGEHPHVEWLDEFR